jgi:hypothetical protein
MEISLQVEFISAILFTILFSYFIDIITILILESKYSIVSTQFLFPYC